MYSGTRYACHAGAMHIRERAVTPNLDNIIWQLVASIPRGRVATYGQIARLAGYPGHARYVGRALGQLPGDSALPWHRVVNAQGKLSLPAGGEACTRQRSLLESEGVVFTGDRLSLQACGWQP